MKQENLCLIVHLFTKPELEKVLDTADDLGIKYIPGWNSKIRIMNFPTLFHKTKECEAFIELTGVSM